MTVRDKMVKHPKHVEAPKWIGLGAMLDSLRLIYKIDLQSDASSRRRFLYTAPLFKRSLIA